MDEQTKSINTFSIIMMLLSLFIMINYSIEIGVILFVVFAGTCLFYNGYEREQKNKVKG